MKNEIEAAVKFLTKLIAKSDQINEEKIDQFRERLVDILSERFRDHWFPDEPNKGQAFRCIRINTNDRHDPNLEAACNQCQIEYDQLKLPIELTLWVDPEEVTCRFGEHKGSYCVVAKFKEGNQENYIDQINIDELEKRSVERAKQASFDMLNSRKKRQAARLKNHNWPTPAYLSNYDYLGTGLIPTTSSPNFSPSFYNSPQFGHNPYGSSPPGQHQPFKYPLSPPQSRSLSNAAYRNNKLVYGSPLNGKLPRQLQSAFNSAAFSSPFVYSQNDRYHWVNSNNKVFKA